MADLKHEHRAWIDNFLKQVTDTTPVKAGPDVLKTGPGFGNSRSCSSLPHFADHSR